MKRKTNIKLRVKKKISSAVLSRRLSELYKYKVRNGQMKFCIEFFSEHQKIST